MNIKEAQAAIAAILDSIPDSDLPKPDRIDQDADYGPTVWWGGHGYHIASPRNGKGEPNPESYRRDAAWQPIEMEIVYRASKAYFANGGELITSDTRRNRKAS